MAPFYQIIKDVESRSDIFVVLKTDFNDVIPFKPDKNNNGKYPVFLGYLLEL